MAAVLAGSAAVPPPAQAISPEAFLQLPAIQAFREGRYQDAIDGLKTLPVSGPDDAIILRYIALAHQQLNDHEAALDAIDRGLAIAPDNAALHYFRAVSLLEVGEAAAARDSLAQVQSLAPDSLYAQQSQLILGALQGLTDGEPGAADDSLEWTAYLEAGAQYDSNIPAAPDGFGTKIGGFRTYERAGGTVQLWQSGPWALESDADVYYSQHLDSEFRDFDTITGTIGATLTHVTSLGELPVSFGAGYHFEMSWVGYDPFSRTHSLDLTALAAPTDDTLAQLRYELGFDEFDNDGVLPTVTSRDAVSHNIGLTGYWFVDGRDHYLYAGYTFGYSQAEGSNFDSRSHSVAVGGTTHVSEDIRLDGGVTYLREDYPNFVGPTQRQTDRFDVTLGAAKEIFDNTELSASWTYIDENSSIDVLTYDQHVGTISVILSF